MAARLAACRFPSRAAKARALAAFLRSHGDGLPASAIRAATSPEALPGWTAWCAPGRASGRALVAAMRYEHNDWYLCTVKNAAVHRDLRGRGIGNKLFAEVVKRAQRDRRCLVVAGDITVTNTPSIKAAMHAGLRVANTFCWRRGQPPARILHMVKLPPSRAGRCA